MAGWLADYVPHRDFILVWGPSRTRHSGQWLRYRVSVSGRLHEKDTGCAFGHRYSGVRKRNRRPKAGAASDVVALILVIAGMIAHQPGRQRVAVLRVDDQERTRAPVARVRLNRQSRG